MDWMYSKDVAVGWPACVTHAGLRQVGSSRRNANRAARLPQAWIHLRFAVIHTSRENSLSLIRADLVSLHAALS
jgi:hypothetical protein